MEWLFDICCKIMSSLGDMVGLTYKEICVIGNIYIQGGILVLSSFAPFIALIRMMRKKASIGKGLYLLPSIIYGMACCFLFLLVCIRYIFPLTEAFDKCVFDLNILSNFLNLSYEAVNILIFIILWGIAIAWNLFITKLILKDKIIGSFVAMIIAIGFIILIAILMFWYATCLVSPPMDEDPMRNLY